jgi:hypothetical protein
MTRVFQPDLDSDWRLVSERRPCPICGASSVCRTHPDGDFACCVREPSEWPMTNGAWLHRIVEVEVIDPVSTGTRRDELAAAPGELSGASP